MCPPGIIDFLQVGTHKTHLCNRYFSFPKVQKQELKTYRSGRWANLGRTVLKSQILSGPVFSNQGCTFINEAGSGWNFVTAGGVDASSTLCL